MMSKTRKQNAQGERNAHGIFLGEHIAQRKMDVQHALRILERIDDQFPQGIFNYCTQSIIYMC